MVGKEMLDDARRNAKYILELETENKRLKEAIKNVPTDEYGRAEREGCDSCGAWDCFLEKLTQWREQALKGE